MLLASGIINNDKVQFIYKNMCAQTIQENRKQN